ncbi:Uncharacterised protein [Shigella flexneri]|nr:Uncharacterised protein [Shigella flexneri]
MVAVQEVQPECPRRAHCDNQKCWSNKVCRLAPGQWIAQFGVLPPVYVMANGRQSRADQSAEARLRYLPVGEAVLYLIPLQRDWRIVLPVVDLSYAVK